VTASQSAANQSEGIGTKPSLVRDQGPCLPQLSVGWQVVLGQVDAPAQRRYPRLNIHLALLLVWDLRVGLVDNCSVRRARPLGVAGIVVLCSNM
jgi:hypothetical protein